MTYGLVIAAVNLLLLLGAGCNNAEPRAEQNAVAEGSIMLETDGIEYPLRFANAQKNSHVPVSTNAAGKLLWSKPYVLPRVTVTPLDAFISKEAIGVKSSDDLLVYGLTGEFRFSVPIGNNSPVMFGNGAFAYLKPSYLLEYRDYTGKLLLELRDIPAFEKYTTGLLFCPTRDDLLAAVQFEGGPQELPKRYDVYRYPIEGSRRIWSYDGDGQIDYAFLTTDRQTVVVVKNREVSVMNAADGKPQTPFLLEMEDIKTMSLSLENNLVVVGSKTVDGAAVQAVDIVSLPGRLVWSYQLAAPKLNQPPVCGTDGKVYIVDDGWLKCLQTGEPLWMAALELGPLVWLTSTGNDKVVALTGNRLSLISADGGLQFSVEVTEKGDTFNVPVAIDKLGRLIVAGNKSLYCFE
jgi:outer membrane protein assembly factor BamB